MRKRMMISIPVEGLGYDGMAAELERCLYRSIIEDLKISLRIIDPLWQASLRKKIRTLRKLRSTISSKIHRARGHQMRFMPIVPTSSKSFERFLMGETRVTFSK